MCGFAGIVAWDDKYHVTRPVLEKMSACIAHRGPDGQGLYLNHEKEATPDRPQVGLVHRRLAILDPDPRSNQPFKDEAGRWLVFNGEIYNYRELRQELKSLRPDYEWRTDGDTEVLLLSYAVWGENCVDHLNGMFAFAVWDEPKRSLYCAIDRMGQKPLYFAAIDTAGTSWIGLKSTPGAEDSALIEGAINPSLAAIGIASELGAITSMPWVAPDLDWRSLEAYLHWGYISATRTVYTTVRKVAPGVYGAIHNQSARVKRYFDPNIKSADAKKELTSHRLKLLARQAVGRQMVADVPIGCLLSGGIDSSVVAALMKSVAPEGQPILTFSIGFDDLRYDEAGYATAVAKHLGTVHHQFIMRPNVVEDLPKLIEVFGEPFADSSALPMHYLARETRAFVKVALSGDGADELFGGYDRYRAMHMAAALDATPWIVRKAAASAVWQRLPGTHPKSLLTKLKRFLQTVESDPLHRYLALMRLFDVKTISALLMDQTHPMHASDWAFASVMTRFLADLEPAPAALALDRITYLPGDLLTKVDRCSMLHALEVRSPFMDHELVQFAAGLTTDQLLRGGPKRMLREAFAADLPDFVFKRKKMGFAVPIGEWFRGELRPMLRDHLFAVDSFASQHFVRKTVERLVEEHESQRVDHAQRLYALLMLELWWRTTRR